MRRHIMADKDLIKLKYVEGKKVYQGTINRQEFLNHMNYLVEKFPDNNEISKFIRILVSNLEGEVDRETLQSKIGIKHRQHFRNAYLKPSLDEGYIEFTLPNEKQSKLQKYRLTAKGLALKESLKNSK